MRLGETIALVVLCGAVSSCREPAAETRAAAPRPSPTSASLGSIHGDNLREVQATDGLITISDRSVACRIEGQTIACDNGLATVACDGARCVGGRAGGIADISRLDADEPAAKLVPAKTLLFLRGTSCFVEPTYIECHVADYSGGFAISGLFARVASYDDAPAGWPWDGRPHTEKDKLPGI